MKNKKIKPRNWNAVNAHFRKAGLMKDKKKEHNKTLCREKITEKPFTFESSDELTEDDLKWFENIEVKNIVLNKEEYEKILDLIENPPEPNEKLKKLLNDPLTPKK